MVGQTHVGCERHSEGKDSQEPCVQAGMKALVNPAAYKFSLLHLTLVNSNPVCVSLPQATPLARPALCKPYLP